MIFHYYYYYMIISPFSTAACFLFILLLFIVLFYCFHYRGLSPAAPAALLSLRRRLLSLRHYLLIAMIIDYLFSCATIDRRLFSFHFIIEDMPQRASAPYAAAITPCARCRCRKDAFMRHMPPRRL